MSYHFFVRILLLSIASLLFSCSHEAERRAAFEAMKAAPTAPAVSEKEEEPYDPSKIAPGFLIRLSYPEDRDLSGSFRVGFDGTLDLPYNVRMQVEGLTIEELRTKLLATYRPYYKNKTNFNLSVAVEERAYIVELRGLIAKPGKYRLRADSSIDEAVSMAGGFPSTAENQPRFLKITRASGSERTINLEEYYRSGAQREGEHWRGGEILFLQREQSLPSDGTLEAGNQVIVHGELRRPGEFQFRDGADVYFYMSAAGGPTANTEFDKVMIYRGPSGHRKALAFDLEEPEKAPSVRPGDMLVFEGEHQTPFQKTINIAASIAAILSTIALVIIAV